MKSTIPMSGEINQVTVGREKELERETAEVIRVLDASEAASFAANVWAVGNAFKQSAPDERKALLAFVNTTFGDL